MRVRELSRIKEETIGKLKLTQGCYGDSELSGAETLEGISNSWKLNTNHQIVN